MDRLSTVSSALNVIKFFHLRNNLDNNSMNTDERVISKVKFISRIKKGTKINIRTMTMDPDTLFTRVKRTFYDTDSRDNTLDFCCTSIRHGFDILIKHLNSEKDYEKELGNALLFDFILAEEGLNNLKYTYIDDTMFCCNIDTLIQDMKSRLKSVSEKYSIVLPKPKIDDTI